MTGVRGESRPSKPLWISAVLVWSLAATTSAALFGPPAVQPAYSGGAPLNSITPIAGVSGSFNSNIDGYADAAIVNLDDDLLLIYESDAIGTLHLVHTYGIFNFTAPRSIATGDVNGDGKLDLVVGDLNGVSVLLGDGTGAFAAASPQRPAGLAGPWAFGTTEIFLADVNGDGRLDIVAVKDDPGGALEFGEWHLVVLLNQGGGKFGSPTDYDLDVASGSGGITLFAFGDYDGDFLPDVMYQDYDHIRFMKGHANGTFASPTVARDLTGSNFVSGRAVAAADIDGDGKLDFVSTSGIGNIFWCKGNGNGTLQAPILIAPLAQLFEKPFHLFANDLDNDGRPDIVVAGEALLQQSNHTFVFAQSVGTSAETEPLATGDFNHDQRADLIMQGPDPQTIAVYKSTSGPATHVLILAGTPQSTEINTAFPETLIVEVLDANNIGVPNVQVTFTPPPGFGASAGVNPAITFTNPTGFASTTATANDTIGCYTLNATVQGVSGTFPFSLCNTAPDHLVILAGTPQSVAINTSFPTALQVKVVDGSNVGKDGITVTFSAPTGGGVPTAILSPASAVTAGGGFAQVSAAANGISGSYAVNVSAPGISPPQAPPFFFALTNSAPPSAAAQIILSLLTSPQATLINTAFGSPLQVRVVDNGSVGVAGAQVDYAVSPDPVTGASANLSAGSAVTDGSGFAQVTATANGLVGSYGVKVTVDGNASVPAGSISLRNFAPLPHSIALVSGTPQITPVTTLFPQTLQVKLTDTLGNPTPQVQVFFVAPTSGASAVLSQSSVLTDANGIAQVTATANASAGSYQVGAVVFHTTIEQPIFVAFDLTNTLESTAAGIPTLTPGMLLATAVLLAAAGFFLVRFR